MTHPLHILQLSASDRMGGAEKIAMTLFNGYRAQGHRSWLAVGQKTTTDPDIFLLDNDRSRSPWSRLCSAAARSLNPINRVKGIKRLQLLLRDTLGQPTRTARRNRGEEDFDFPATADLLNLPPQRPHLLHCHNLHSPTGYFDLRALPHLSKQLPVVLTLHDAWLLSGHCAHSFECDRWKTGCGQCPDLSIYPSIPRDATAFNWSRKKSLFEQSRLFITTPSQWLMDRVQQSILAPAIADAKVIHNGIDLDIFHPADPRAARAALNLPLDARILLFAANHIRSNPFRDFATMQEALRRVAHNWQGPPLLFVALGEDLPEEKIASATLRFVPFQKDERAVARYYQAADLYVHGTRADTFPTTVLEALACGKPVVASRVGGIPEQVNENQTGHLVPIGDPAAMASALLSLLTNDPKRQSMSDAAAQTAKDRFNRTRQIDQTLAWYQAVVVTGQPTTDN